jgi:carbamoyltransferase
MITWGINALNHGSSIAVFDNDEYKISAVSDRDTLPSEIIRRALDQGAPDHIFWYEQPWLKKARQVYAGQWRRALDMTVLPRRYLNENRLQYAKLSYTQHHASHAAAGYYTSPFNHCAIVVLDAIGEFECATIWEGRDGEMKKIWSRSYPHSLGLFYSAFTALLGMTPIRDEYLLQQMAAKGHPDRYRHLVHTYMSGLLTAGKNMHKGIVDWPHDTLVLSDQYDVAAAVQAVFEEQIASVMYKAKKLTGADSLVYMGGCAMNSTANIKVVEPKFKYIWSLPSPGDPSSAMGAVLYHTKQRVDYNWGTVKHIKISV